MGRAGPMTGAPLTRSCSGSSTSSGPDPQQPQGNQRENLRDGPTALETAHPTRAQDLPPPSPEPGEHVPLEVVTVNVTSVGPLKKFLETTRAHVVLAQEIKTSGPTTEALKDWARRHGWKILVTDADYRPHTGAHSAGVAILARDWLGLGWPPGCGPTTKEGRVIIGMLECPFLPPMLIASMYLKTRIG